MTTQLTTEGDQRALKDRVNAQAYETYQKGELVEVAGSFPFVYYRITEAGHQYTELHINDYTTLFNITYELVEANYSSSSYNPSEDMYEEGKFACPHLDEEVLNNLLTIAYADAFLAMYKGGMPEVDNKEAFEFIDRQTRIRDRYFIHFAGNCAGDLRCGYCHPTGTDEDYRYEEPCDCCGCVDTDPGNCGEGMSCVWCGGENSYEGAEDDL